MTTENPAEARLALEVHAHASRQASQNSHPSQVRRRTAPAEAEGFHPPKPKRAQLLPDHVHLAKSHALAIAHILDAQTRVELHVTTRFL